MYIVEELKYRGAESALTLINKGDSLRSQVLWLELGMRKLFLCSGDYDELERRERPKPWQKYSIWSLWGWIG